MTHYILLRVEMTDKDLEQEEVAEIVSDLAAVGDRNEANLRYPSACDRKYQLAHIEPCEIQPDVTTETKIEISAIGSGA